MKIIGIDPDYVKCGICFLHDGEIVDIASKPPIWIINKMPQWIAEGYKISIENTLKTTAIYTKNRKQSPTVNEKIALSVGKVQGVTKILIDCIEFHYGDLPILAPAGVGKQVKNNAELFKQLTGWEGRTNSDKRDAYAIAKYGENILTNKK